MPTDWTDPHRRATAALREAGAGIAHGDAAMRAAVDGAHLRVAGTNEHALPSAAAAELPDSATRPAHFADAGIAEHLAAAGALVRRARAAMP